MSDPVKALFLVIGTHDGGSHWEIQHWDGLLCAPVKLHLRQVAHVFIIKHNRLFLVSGGAKSSVYRAMLLESDGSFSRSDTPLVSGSNGSGIFSIAMLDHNNGVIVGGNYEKPNEAKDNLAFTTDGGKTWKLGTGLSGYRSGVDLY